MSSTLRYSVAVGSAVAAIVLRLILEPIWGLELPYLTLFPAIMLSAWFGGFGPGTVTTALSAAAAAYLWIDPGRAWSVSDPGAWLGLLVFVFAGIVVSALNEAWRRGTRALSEAEQRLDVTLRSIGDAVITTDDEGRVTRVNAVAETLTGWRASQAVGRPLPEVFVIINEQSREPAPHPIHRVLRDGVIAGLANHTLLVSRDGREISIDDSAAPIKGPDGRTSGAILVFRDITERRRIERERASRERAAREMAAIVESSDDAIISKDLDSTIRSWNRGAETLFGYTAAEAIGRSIRIIIPEARWSEEEEVLRRLRRGEKVDHFETVRRRKNGSELPVSLTISPIHSADGVVIGASKIARDISERKQVENERAQLLARERSARADIERASRLKDDFLAMLSHELRTPLNAVLGYTQLLSSGAVPPERAAHALQAIQRNAQAQARLVESLLDLSRVIAGKLELNLEELDLLSVLDAAVDVLRPEAEARDISFDVVVPNQRVALIGDGARLQQVFWNLLSNAIKFSPRGGHVRIGVTAEQAEVRVQVSDDGQGISADFLPYVFDRFKQAEREQRRSPAGLGLGLSLVREMVQAHGGTVVAESPGEDLGSTFTVALPTTATTTRPVADAPNQAPIEETARCLSGLEILVVDDERDARDLLALLLATRGALVRTVSSAAAALDAMGKQRPDLLLADLGLPDEDGYSLIRRLRTHERDQGGARVPAIALTAHSGSNDRERVIAAGFDWHVAKPVDPHALIRAINRVTRAEGTGGDARVGPGSSA
jgi:PAS domain S-box-containing protein